MRLLVDMNLTPRWIACLNGAGREARHWSSLGSASAKDREICEYARGEGYVLLTNDLGFPQILAHTGGAKPSIVLLRGEPLVPELRGDALPWAPSDCGSDLQRGAIVTLDWPGHPRARVVPLR